MVKRGYAVCEEKEAYSTKSTLCCHGLLNKCMKNGQDVVTFRNGKYNENLSKMPREVHGILICQKCERTWNRDFVGAVYIYDIYVARMNEWARPVRFARKYWQDKKRYLQCHYSKWELIFLDNQCSGLDACIEFLVEMYK